MADETIVTPKPIAEKKDDPGDAGDNKGNGKNSQTILIVAIVVVVLCCCCLIAGGAGYYAYTRFRSVDSSSLQPSDQIVVPQSDFSDDNPPSGGLGNEILKNDTWKAMVPAAVALGCDRPIGANSTIEVIQQPDENGVWIEHWTVACQSGDTYLFEVQFILDDTGATFNIKPLQ